MECLINNLLIRQQLQIQIMKIIKMILMMIKNKIILIKQIIMKMKNKLLITKKLKVAITFWVLILIILAVKFDKINKILITISYNKLIFNNLSFFLLSITINFFKIWNTFVFSIFFKFLSFVILIFIYKWIFSNKLLYIISLIILFIIIMFLFYKYFY